MSVRASVLQLLLPAGVPRYFLLTDSHIAYLVKTEN